MFAFDGSEIMLTEQEKKEKNKNIVVELPKGAKERRFGRPITSASV
jgi:hypothetical protein